jgi:hypothetical protein
VCHAGEEEEWRVIAEVPYLLRYNGLCDHLLEIYTSHCLYIVLPNRPKSKELHNM